MGSVQGRHNASRKKDSFCIFLSEYKGSTACHCRDVFSVAVHFGWLLEPRRPATPRATYAASAVVASGKKLSFRVLSNKYLNSTGNWTVFEALHFAEFLAKLEISTVGRWCTIESWASHFKRSWFESIPCLQQLRLWIFIRNEPQRVWEADNHRACFNVRTRTDQHSSHLSETAFSMRGCARPEYPRSRWECILFRSELGRLCST